MRSGYKLPHRRLPSSPGQNQNFIAVLQYDFGVVIDRCGGWLHLQDNSACGHGVLHSCQRLPLSFVLQSHGCSALLKDVLLIDPDRLARQLDREQVSVWGNSPCPADDGTKAISGFGSSDFEQGAKDKMGYQYSQKLRPIGT
jgi:hypothetical protein